MHGPYYIYSYLPNAHLVYNKEIRISTAHMVSLTFTTISAITITYSTLYLLVYYKIQLG